jgi:molybdopterin/thiamine biosynthesis adenylyltransferase
METQEFITEAGAMAMAPTPVVETAPKNAKHTRFSELMWYDPNHDIIVGGVGGIGSWLAMLLGRAGYTLHLFDDDTIDETNMAGQLYTIANIGSNKAAAIANSIYAYSQNSKVETYGRYTAESEACPITFSCFDNMAARKLLFENWAAQEDRSIFIDGRMLAESFQIYAVVKGKEEEYRATLFDDGEVQEQPCSAKATSHTAAIIGGMMTGILTNHMSNVKLDMNIREVPFMVTFEIPLLTFNIILQ